MSLASGTSFADFYTLPLSIEGAPGGVDPEYFLKPLEERIPSGVPRRFYENSLKRNLVFNDKGILRWNHTLTDYKFPDQEIKNDFIELTAKPFQVFDQKLKAQNNSEKKAAKWMFIFVPSRLFLYNDAAKQFWIDLCRQKNFDLLDLSESFNALKTSFYPVWEPRLNNHFTIHGNALIAQLLCHYLIEKKWVLFESEKEKSPSVK